MGTPYTLLHPFTVRNQVQGQPAVETPIAEVELRRLTGADMRWMDTQKANNAQGLGLIARLTGLNSAIVDQFDVEDVAELSDIIAGFLPAGLRPGATS